jgi:hypothetical protein
MASSHLLLVTILVVIAAALTAAEGPKIWWVSSEGGEYLSSEHHTWITIHGGDFPCEPSNVTIAGVLCKEPWWEKEEKRGEADPRGGGDKVKCKADPGVGSHNLLVLTFKDGTQLTHHVNFEPVTVSPCAISAAADIEISNTINPTEQLTICGANFGASWATYENKWWTGIFYVSVGGIQAEIVWNCEEYLIFQVPSGGGLNNVRLVAGTTVADVPYTISYPNPAPTSASLVSSRNTRATSEVINVFGRYFGPADPHVHLTVTIGGFPCTRIQHFSDSELQCTVYNGYGANQGIFVITNTEPSVPYDGISPARYDFVNSAVPGLSCVPPFGAPDIINNAICNCFSGYASSDALLGTDCNLHAICPGQLTSQTVVSQFPPARPTTEFKEDHLYIKQVVPIVKNRRDTIIQFVIPALTGINDAGTVSSETCFYPGVIWHKKLNELDCTDEYYGRLPWTQNVLCGFVQDPGSNAVTLTFKSTLVTTYTETFKKGDQLLFRKVSNAYLVAVSFTRQVTILKNTQVTVIIADPNDPSSLSIFVDGDALYDVASKDTIISFETTVVWPYELNDVILTGSWYSGAGVTGYVSATAVLATEQPGEDVCDFQQDTDCTQSWLLTIDTNIAENQVCNLFGTVSFSTQQLLCRDLPPSGGVAPLCPGTPTPQTNFTINIGTTDLCDDAPDVDASAGLSYVLEPFYDPDWNVPQNVFQTGDMIFFEVIVNDPVGTIDQVTFNTIQLNGPATKKRDPPSDTLYYTATAGDIGSSFANVDFNITREKRSDDSHVTPPGRDVILAFQFRLNREYLTTVYGLSPDNSKLITVEVIIDIWYHGNQRRTVVLAGAQPATTHSSITFYDLANGADADAENVNPDEEAVEDDVEENILSESGLFGNGALTVAPVFAVVVLAALALLA